jgi:hypothetical protein
MLVSAFGVKVLSHENFFYVFCFEYQTSTFLKGAVALNIYFLISLFYSITI